MTIDYLLIHIYQMYLTYFLEHNISVVESIETNNDMRLRVTVQIQIDVRLVVV